MSSKGYANLTKGQKDAFCNSQDCRICHVCLVKIDSPLLQSCTLMEHNPCNLDHQTLNLNSHPKGQHALLQLPFPSLPFPVRDCPILIQHAADVMHWHLYKNPLFLTKATVSTPRLRISMTALGIWMKWCKVLVKDNLTIKATLSFVFCTACFIVIKRSGSI